MNWRLFLLWPMFLAGAALVLAGFLIAAVFIWPLTLWVDPNTGTNFEGDRVQL